MSLRNVELFGPLNFIFDLSLEKGILPDDLKIVRVTPVFKGGGRSELGHFRLISKLPCFSKTLESTMFNCSHKYLFHFDI